MSSDLILKQINKKARKGRGNNRNKKLISVLLFFVGTIFLLFLLYSRDIFAQAYDQGSKKSDKKSREKSNEKFYGKHAEGWHWYNEAEVERKAKRKEREKNEQLSKSFSEPKDPTKKMDALRSTIKRALHKAILNPTDNNVRNYISLQNKLSNQATLFANVWQRVLLNNPGLNYSLVHPTNSLAKQVDLDLQRKKEDVAIAKLAKESGLFFFYRSSCLYCRKFAPIIKRFASSHKITVIPITLDGIVLPEFPGSKTDKGQAAKFNVTVEPSLFAVNPYNKKAYPISYGLVSEEALRERILDVVQNFIGEM